MSRSSSWRLRRILRVWRKSGMQAAESLVSRTRDAPSPDRAGGAAPGIPAGYALVTAVVRIVSLDGVVDRQVEVLEVLARVDRGAVQEARELARPHGVAQLAHGLGLDLAHALARHAEDATDLFQGVGIAVADAVAQLDDLALAEGERVEHLVDALAQHLVPGGLHRALDRLVLDEVAEIAVVGVADRPVERDRVLRALHHALGLVDGDARGLGHLLDRGLADLLLHELLRDVAQLRHGLDHVHRDADRARLVGDRARDRLADPPRGIGRELVAAAVLVLLDGLHQAGVALLDEVQEREPAVAVLLGDRDHQAQVAARELALGFLVLLEVHLDLVQAPLEALGGLERHELELGEALAQLACGVAVGLRALEREQLALDRAHLAEVLLEHLDVGPHLLDLQVALLGQDHELAAEDLDLLELLGALLARRLGVEQRRVLGADLPEQAPDRLDVDGQAQGQELLAERLDDLRVVVGLGVGIDLERSVEGQLAAQHLLERLERGRHAQPRAHGLLAEALARDLDRLRQEDLLVACEQRDLAHLREVHAHRVVDALRRHAALENRRDRLGHDLRGRPALALGDTRSLDVGIVDHLDAALLERQEDLVHPLGRHEAVLQERIDLRVREEALLGAFLGQEIDGLLDFLGHGSG